MHLFRNVKNNNGWIDYKSCTFRNALVARLWGRCVYAKLTSDFKDWATCLEYEVFACWRRREWFKARESRSIKYVVVSQPKLHSNGVLSSNDGNKIQFAACKSNPLLVRFVLGASESKGATGKRTVLYFGLCKRWWARWIQMQFGSNNWISNSTVDICNAIRIRIHHIFAQLIWWICKCM